MLFGASSVLRSARGSERREREMPQKGALRSSSRSRAAAGLLLVVSLLAGGCATAPQNVVKELWVPPSQDVWDKVPAGGFNLTHRDGTTRHVSHAFVRNLVAVKGQIEQVSGFRADLGLVDTELPNAFSFHYQGRPLVAISLSWLDRLGNDRDALAITIGHELAHLHLGHSGLARKEREDAAKGASQVVGLLLSFAGVPMGGTIASAGFTAYARSFSRDEERAADEHAIKWAVAAGFDPCGGVRTMRMYQRLRANAVDVPFLSTHPGAEERADAANDASLKARGKACGD